MKSSLMVLVLLAFTSAAQAAIIGCDFTNAKEFERLPEIYDVKVHVVNDIIVTKGDYQSAANYELWMKKKAESQTIKGKADETVVSIELLGDDGTPDSLILHFGPKSAVDTFAFYSRDEKSVIEKLQDSQILTLKCSPKK